MISVRKKILVFLLFCLFICLLSCSTQKVQNPFNSIELPQSSQSEKQHPFIAFSLEDILTKNDSLNSNVSVINNNENYFIISPIILPYLTNINVTPNDLLVGYNSPEGEFFLPPSIGSCRIISHQGLKNSEKNLLYSIILPKKFFGEIFLVMKDGNPVALASPNDNGWIQCFLPKDLYHFLWFSGIENKDVLISPDSKGSFYLKSIAEIGDLDIYPDISNGIQVGDILRIGRRNLSSNDNSAFYPIWMDHAFHQKGNILSQKLGFSRFISTNFLVNSTSFQIKLSSGDYKVAIIRHGSLYCVQDFTITTNSHSILKCDPSSLINNIEVENSFAITKFLNYELDATYYPEQVAMNLTFRNWLFSYPSELLMLFPAKLQESEHENFLLAFYKKK